MSDMQRRDFLRAVLIGAAAALMEPLAAASARGAPEPFTVYLTFDDGPTTHPNLTGPTIDVLDTLRAAQAPATFFLHGRSVNDWEGPVIARMIREGHAVGNHLWRQGGNTALDGATWTLLAQQYIVAEQRIRDVLKAADAEAYRMYLVQPRLYRRPGGNNGLTGFLDLKNYELLARSPYLRPYLDRLEWLKGVYDYSGWHIVNGDGVPLNRPHPQTADEAIFWALHGSYGYLGLNDYLCAGDPPRRSLEVGTGLIMLMHDAAAITVEALPRIIALYRERGAQFRALPRPQDKPNADTVGIGYAPTPDPDGLPCDLTGP